jgi:hypothetical protein
MALNRVAAQLTAFAQADLLAAMPKNGPILWYMRKDSPVWGAFVVIADALEDDRS